MQQLLEHLCLGNNNTKERGPFTRWTPLEQLRTAIQIQVRISYIVAIDSADFKDECSHERSTQSPLSVCVILISCCCQL